MTSSSQYSTYYNVAPLFQNDAQIVEMCFCAERLQVPRVPGPNQNASRIQDQKGSTPVSFIYNVIDFAAHAYYFALFSNFIILQAMLQIQGEPTAVVVIAGSVARKGVRKGRFVPVDGAVQVHRGKQRQGSLGHYTGRYVPSDLHSWCCHSVHHCLYKE